MIYELRKVSVWSVAKVSFILGGALGFVGGLFLWMFAGLVSQVPLPDYGDAGSFEGLGGLGAALPFFMSIFYAFAFMIANGIMAGIYNLMSGVVGGLEVTLAVPADLPAAPWPGPATPQPPQAHWSQAPPQQPPPPPPAPPAPPATGP